MPSSPKPKSDRNRAGKLLGIRPTAAGGDSAGVYLLPWKCGSEDDASNYAVFRAFKGAIPRLEGSSVGCDLPPRLFASQRRRETSRLGRYENAGQRDGDRPVELGRTAAVPPSLQWLVIDFLAANHEITANPCSGRKIPTECGNTREFLACFHEGN